MCWARWCVCLACWLHAFRLQHLWTSEWINLSIRQIILDPFSVLDSFQGSQNSSPLLCFYFKLFVMNKVQKILEGHSATALDLPKLKAEEAEEAEEPFEGASS